MTLPEGSPKDIGMNRWVPNMTFGEFAEVRLFCHCSLIWPCYSAHVRSRMLALTCGCVWCRRQLPSTTLKGSTGLVVQLQNALDCDCLGRFRILVPLFCVPV